ncbi:MAG TPA: flagellar biosynthesis protein FliQ [Chloroflexi bacterium]|nr:flagellar biosynthesis protein FliQ [Chloroflexota bacterium]
MTEAYVLDFAQNALIVMLILAGPVLLVSLIIGSVISLIQAATQISEITLTFVPKIIGISVVLAIFGPWMGAQLISFTVNLFTSLATIPR